MPFSTGIGKGLLCLWNTDLLQHTSGVAKRGPDGEMHPRIPLTHILSSNSQRCTESYVYWKLYYSLPFWRIVSPLPFKKNAHSSNVAYVRKDWNYTSYNGRWQDHYTVRPNAITSSILNNTEFKDSLMRTQVLIPPEKVKPEPRFDSTQMKWRWYILFSPLTGGCRVSWSKDLIYIHCLKTRFHFPYYPCPIYMPRLHDFAQSCKLLNSAKSC